MEPLFRRPPDQLGIVVRDIHHAMEQWLALGAGPFLHGAEVPMEGWSYRGRTIDFSLDVGVSFLGSLQIELLSPCGRGDSPFHEFVDAGRDGLHHLCWRVADIGEVARRAEAPLCLEASFAGIQFAYVDSGTDPMIELVAESEAAEKFWSALQAPTIDWDGNDPIRPISSVFG